MTATLPGPGSAGLLADVHALLALEARLLDDREYHRWLGLFTDPCLYWMPVDPLSQDGPGRLNVIYDDRGRLQDRIARLTSGSAFTEEPPTLTARVISAVKLVDHPDGGAVRVRSTFMLLAHRRGELRVFGGQLTHHLIWQDGQLRIAHKRVGLLGSDAPQRSMTFLF